jgi:hypothetical protein
MRRIIIMPWMCRWVLPGHQELPVHGHDGPGAGAGALLAPVARETEKQRHRPLHQIAVVVLARVPTDEDLGLPRGHLARQLADVVRVELADLPRLLRRVLLEVAPQPREHRFDLHATEVLEQHLEAPLERRIDTRRGQGVARGGDQHARERVPPEELILALALVDLVAAQEAPGILSHQERQVGLFLHELLLVEIGVDDHFAHRERQGGVGADAHGQVVVGVDGRWAVVGSDGDDPASVVSRLGDVVVPVDVGVHGIGVPDQCLDGVEHLVRDVVEGLVP